MGQRILTDSYGGRWDVADTGEGGLRFNHPPDGPSYEVQSEKGVDALKDTELIQMLDNARTREGEDAVSEGGSGGSPGGGY